MKRICLNCEYFDIGGFKAGDSNGDCHNSNSPRFTPEPDFVCAKFYPSTTYSEEEFLKKSGSKSVQQQSFCGEKNG